MKRLLFIVLPCLFSITALKAQTPEEVYNQHIDYYFKEKDFDWKKVKQAFDAHLKSQGIQISKNSKGASYHDFLSNYKDAALKRTVASDLIVKELQKLGSIYATEFESGYGYPELHPWWYGVYNQTRGEMKGRVKVGPNRGSMGNLASEFMEGHLSTAKTAAILGDFYDAESLNTEVHQKVVVCVMLVQLLPSLSKEKAVEALSKVEEKLERFYAKHGLQWSDIKHEFDRYIGEQYDISAEGDDSPDYLAVFDSIGFAESLPKLSDPKPWFKSVPNRKVTYTELHDDLKMICVLYAEHLDPFDPVMGYCSILEAISEAVEVSPAILVGGYNVNYSDHHVAMTAHQKCFITLLFPIIIDGWERDLFEEPADVVDGLSEEEEVFMVVEQDPEYPGGNSEMFRFIGKNVEYPQTALENKISGTVYVAFVVDKDGSIRDVELVRGIGGGCDEEAIRVITMMPRWTPGTQKGKAVAVRYTLPIAFRLN